VVGYSEVIFGSDLPGDLLAAQSAHGKPTRYPAGLAGSRRGMCLETGVRPARSSASHQRTEERRGSRARPPWEAEQRSSLRSPPASRDSQPSELLRW